MENMKNWENTIVTVIGTMRTDKDGKILFVENKFGKFTATVKVAEDDPWAILARENTFVFVDGIRKEEVGAFQRLENKGTLNGSTKLAITGHLVRTPGKPGMNDILNMKVTNIHPAKDGQTGIMNFDEALTREEWQKIYNEKRYGSAAPAPSAVEAPVAPEVPF